MKLSFVKTLEGHEIEFVRLLYPLRYDLFLRQMQANPIRLSYKVSDDGVWSLDDKGEELPGWVKELSMLIHNTIEENEATDLEE